MANDFPIQLADVFSERTTDLSPFRPTHLLFSNSSSYSRTLRETVRPSICLADKSTVVLVVLSSHRYPNLNCSDCFALRSSLCPTLVLPKRPVHRTFCPAIRSSQLLSIRTILRANYFLSDVFCSSKRSLLRVTGKDSHLVVEIF